MYYALQKGFERTTGEIMGWLNSDDMLHKNALFTIAEVLKLQEVKWIQGVLTHYDEYDRCINVDSFKSWSKYEFWSGDYQWIQQESTYWHRDLWKKAGGYISCEYKYAGDMELWNRFFKYEKLYSLTCLIGGFRRQSSNQLSLNFNDDYINEAESILSNNVFDVSMQQIIEKIRKNKNKLALLNRWKPVKVLSESLRIKQRISKNLKELYDYPPRISFNRDKQKFFTQEILK